MIVAAVVWMLPLLFRIRRKTLPDQINFDRNLNKMP
jgi:hypothetical protein